MDGKNLVESLVQLGWRPSVEVRFFASSLRLR